MDAMTIVSKKDRSPRYFVDSQGEVTRLYMTDVETARLLTCEHELDPAADEKHCHICGLTESQIKELEKKNNEHSTD